MTVSTTQMLAAAGMLLVTFAMVVGFVRYLVVNSERRMRGMLESIGLDPELATSDEIPTIMKDVRYRCRHCAAESVCDRWLAGEEDGSKDFCPNRRIFEILKKYADGEGRAQA